MSTASGERNADAASAKGISSNERVRDQSAYEHSEKRSHRETNGDQMPYEHRIDQ